MSYKRLFCFFPSHFLWIWGTLLNTFFRATNASWWFSFCRFLCCHLFPAICFLPVCVCVLLDDCFCLTFTALCHTVISWESWRNVWVIQTAWLSSSLNMWVYCSVNTGVDEKFHLSVCFKFVAVGSSSPTDPSRCVSILQISCLQVQLQNKCFCTFIDTYSIKYMKKLMVTMFYWHWTCQYQFLIQQLQHKILEKMGRNI